MSAINYYINKDKRTIVCKITGCFDIAMTRLNKLAPHFDYYAHRGDDFEINDVYVGVAHCDPDDEWNEDIGKDVALTKAKAKRGNAINKVLQKAIRTMRDEADEVMKYGIHNVPTI